MNRLTMTCAQAKQIDLVSYLAGFGHQPTKVRNQDHWYLSPLREESTASFKVNRKLNVWYDHGLGQGGDLVAFGTLYFNCTIADFLHRLSQEQTSLPLSFHQQHSLVIDKVADEKRDYTAGSKIDIQSIRPLADKSLIAYLLQRGIPLDIAGNYCKEVDFLLYEKRHTVIGFPNNSGGYELRSIHFKGSSRPKDSTLITNPDSDQIAVFEGFFSFLSFLKIHEGKRDLLNNYLVLNSLSFLDKSIPLLERYRVVTLYLDRDAAGMKATERALKTSSWFKDGSILYEKHKDFNDFLIHSPPQNVGVAAPVRQEKVQEVLQKSTGQPLPFHLKGRRV